MADTSIASDLSYECLQRRRRLGELRTPPCDQAYRQRYPVAVTGIRGDVLREFYRLLGGDEANSNPPSVAVGEREQ